MAEPTFTQGPWIADAHFAQREGGRTYIPVLRPGNDPVPLAVVHRDVDGYGKTEGEANARLISAAPDLYEAVCLTECPYPIGEGRMATECLAEGNCGCCYGAALRKVYGLPPIDAVGPPSLDRADVCAGDGDEAGEIPGEPT